ncbi:hypothetical protein OROGR_010097 [Orobanche gracilis]
MANLRTASPPSLPPISSLPDPASPILRDAEDRIRRLNLSSMSEDEALLDKEKRMLALRRILGKNSLFYVECPLMRSLGIKIDRD